MKVKLTGTTSNKSAVGVRLKMVVGSKTLTRYVQAHSAFGTQSSLIQHFGLGNATSITSLTLYWPSGIVQTMGPISTVNTTINVTEDNTAPKFSTLYPAAASTTGSVTKLEITFDEEAFGVSGKKVTLARTSDPGTAVHIFDATEGIKTGTKMTFNLPAKLDVHIAFQVSLMQEHLKMWYGNLTDARPASAWTFTTDDDLDSAPPVITFVTGLSSLTKGTDVPNLTVKFEDDKADYNSCVLLSTDQRQGIQECGINFSCHNYFTSKSAIHCYQRNAR
ncbi:MAG: ASPIC/UnbV domain-containing protein [Bacteroidota bacterium]